MNLKKKLERYWQVNLLGLGPRLMKKEFTSRGLTQVEKHCVRLYFAWELQTNMQIAVCFYKDKTELAWHVKCGVESAVVMSGRDDTPPHFLMLWITCHFNVTHNEFSGQHSHKLNSDVLCRLTWRSKLRTLQRMQDKTNRMWWGPASLSLWQVQGNWNLRNNGL
jgi:hypothetical protein